MRRRPQVQRRSPSRAPCPLLRRTRGSQARGPSLHAHAPQRRARASHHPRPSQRHQRVGGEPDHSKPHFRREPVEGQGIEPFGHRTRAPGGRQAEAHDGARMVPRNHHDAPAVFEPVGHAYREDMPARLRLRSLALATLRSSAARASAADAAACSISAAPAAAGPSRSARRRSVSRMIRSSNAARCRA